MKFQMNLKFILTFKRHKVKNQGDKNFPDIMINGNDSLNERNP